MQFTIFRSTIPSRLSRLTTLLLASFSLLTVSAITRADDLTPVHLRVAGKEVTGTTPTLTDGTETYAPLDVLTALGAESHLNRKGDAVRVMLSGGNRKEELAIVRLQGKAYLALSDVARLLDARVFRPDATEGDDKPTTGKPGDTVYLLARVTEARFADGKLEVKTSFPVPYRVRMLKELNPPRGFVDCIGAKVADDFRPVALPDGEKRALRLRTGQNSAEIARIVVELAPGCAFKANDASTRASDIVATLNGSASGNPPLLSSPTQQAKRDVSSKTATTQAAKKPEKASGKPKETQVADLHLQAPDDVETETSPKDQGERNPLERANVHSSDHMPDKPAPPANTTAGAQTNPPAKAQPAPPRGKKPSRGGKARRDLPPVEVRALKLNVVDEKRLLLEIATGGKAAAFVHYAPESNQLVMDIPNAFLRLTNADNAEQSFSHPLIHALHAEQSQETPPVTRVTLAMQRVVGFSVNAQDDKLTLELRLPRNANGVLADKVIVIDPGHGGSSTGAVGRGSDGTVYEKNCTLGIALKLRTALEACGARVVMTRDRDVDVPLYDRPHLANDINADLFISIHNDSNGRPNSASGTSTYYHMGDANSRALAACVQREVMRVTGLPSRGVLSDGIMYSTGFAVLRVSRMPAVLCEVAYINNARDRHKLTDPEFQQRVAMAMADGLRAYVEGRPGTPSEPMPMEPDPPMNDPSDSPADGNAEHDDNR